MSCILCSKNSRIFNPLISKPFLTHHQIHLPKKRQRTSAFHTFCLRTISSIADAILPLRLVLKIYWRLLSNWWALEEKLFGTQTCLMGSPGGNSISVERRSSSGLRQRPHLKKARRKRQIRASQTGRSHSAHNEGRSNISLPVFDQ